MQKLTASRTSKESEQPQTRRRGGSYNSEALEYTTWQLLATHQANNNRQDVITNKSKLEERRRVLAERALRTDTASAVSAAFCLALLDDGIEKPFEKLLETSKDCPDSQMFGNARKALLHTNIFFPFVIAPTRLDKTQINALYNFSISEECTNRISIMLIAARFETGNEIERAVILYATLLTKNFSANSQLANLMRIGDNSPEALYQIGKFIFNTQFSVEKFKVPLIHFFKSAYSKLQTDDVPREIKDSFTDFFQNQEPRWNDIALMCITLSVYNSKHSLEPAARFLSSLAMKGEHIRESPQKACTTLAYAYHRSALPKEKEKLMSILKKFHEQQPDDLWVNSMLASVYTDTLKSPRQDDEESAKRAFEHYQKVYENLFSNPQDYYRKTHPLIPSLPANSYNLAMVFLKFHDRYRSNTKVGPELLARALHLLEQSGKLGNFRSYYQLALQRESQLKNSTPKEELEIIDNYFRCALEGAMTALDAKEYTAILTRYDAFVKKHLPLQQLVAKQYQLRGRDTQSNLKALSLYSNNKYSDKEFKDLATTTPIACALDWENSTLFESTYYKRLIDLLHTRGLSDKQADIITLLTDYFILATNHPQARVFFTCLQRGLSNTALFEDSIIEKLEVLIDFYLNLIDDEILACKTSIKRSPVLCRAAAKRLEEGFLLKPEIYNALQGIFTPQTKELGSARRGLTFFDNTAEAEAFQQWKEMSKDQRTQFVIHSASNSPRDPNATAAGSAPGKYNYSGLIKPLKPIPKSPAMTLLGGEPLERQESAVKPLTVAGPPRADRPKRRLSHAPLKQRPGSAPGDIDTMPPQTGGLPAILEESPSKETHSTEPASKETTPEKAEMTTILKGYN